jgi:hypothetical protein
MVREARPSFCSSSCDVTHPRHTIFTLASNIRTLLFEHYQLLSTHFGTLEGKEIKKHNQCHALYPRRHPTRHEEKARVIVPFVAFQAETKPYGMKSYMPPSLKVCCFGRQVHKLSNQCIYSQLSTSIHQWADNAYGPCMTAAKAIQAWVDVSSSNST